LSGFLGGRLRVSKIVQNRIRLVITFGIPDGYTEMIQEIGEAAAKHGFLYDQNLERRCDER
jgi:hypothetical protein